MAEIRRGNYRWDEELRRWIYDPQGTFIHRRVQDQIRDILAPFARPPIGSTPPEETALKYGNPQAMARFEGPNIPLRRKRAIYDYPLERNPETNTLIPRHGESFASISSDIQSRNRLSETERLRTQLDLAVNLDRFDVFSWAQGGADAGEFLDAARANALQAALSRHSPEQLLKISARYPGIGERLFQDVFDFYSRQFFSYREEGKDVEEHFKSIISRTPIGVFIEEALGHQIEHYKGLHDRASASALDKLVDIYHLKARYQAGEIGFKPYSDASNLLWNDVNALNANIRLYRSRFEDYRRTAYYPPGIQNITKQARELDFNLLDWDQIFRERGLSRNKRVIVDHLLSHRNRGRALTGMMNLFGHQVNLDDHYRRILNALESGLGDKYIPPSGAEQLLIAEQKRINEAYNLLQLRAAGVIAPSVGTDVISKASGAYGLSGRIRQLVDLNAWERSGTGVPTLIENAATGGTPRLGAIIEPTPIGSGHFLNQLGLRPAGVPDLPSADVLQALKRYPANPMWYNGENAEMADAADLVYGRISRGVRRIVGDALNKLGPSQSQIPPMNEAESAFWKRIVGPENIVSAQTVAEQLMAYYHVAGLTRGPADQDEFGKALFDIFTQAGEGDPFAQRVKNILSTIAPGLKDLKSYNIGGELFMQKGFKKTYLENIERAFRAAGMPTRSSLGAQVMDTYEQITRPRSVNERILSYPSAEEMEIGDHAAVGMEHDFGDLSDQMEAASQALKIHDYTMQIQNLQNRLMQMEQGVFTSSDQEALREVAERLRRSQAWLAEFQQELSQATPQTRLRIEHFIRAMGPLRAAEYRSSNFASNAVVPLSVGEGQPIPVEPTQSFIAEATRLSERFRSGVPLEPGWRLSYLMNRQFAESTDVMADRRERNRLLQAQRQEDWLNSLKRIASGEVDRRDINMGNAYDYVARLIGEQYGSPVVTDMLRDVMAGREITPFFGRTVHDIWQNLTRVEGQNFNIENPVFQNYYERLGGTGPLQLHLRNVTPVEIEEEGLYRKNAVTNVIKEFSARFEIPEELSEQEKIRSIAALHMSQFIDEWRNDNLKRQYIEHLDRTGELSDNAVGEALKRAREIWETSDRQFHYLQGFKGVDLQTEPAIPPFEENALMSNFMNLLREDANVKVPTKTLYREAQRLVRILRHFNPQDLGQIVIPVSNAENVAKLAPLDKLAPIIGPRNTVTESRFEKNLAAAHHFFNWNKIYNPETYNASRNTSIFNPSAAPLVNGEQLTRGFFDKARGDLDKALRKQGLNFQLLEDLSGAMGEGGVWLGSKNIDPDIAEMAREIAGGENLLSPLALGQKVDIGSQLTRPLSDLWARYIMTTSADKGELMWLANQLNVDFGERNISKLGRKDIFRIMRQQGLDIDPQTVEKQLVSHFAKQIGILQNEDIQNAMDPSQRARIQSIFKRHQIQLETERITGEEAPRLGEPGRRAQDIGAQAEEELQTAREAAQRGAYKQIGLADIAKLWDNKVVRRSTITLGAFALWGLIRSHHEKERTLASMQGPQNLPDGNTPYTRELPPQTTALPSNSYAIPNADAPGYLYRIRATGNMNPDKFQTQVMNMTNSSVNSGSIYDSRGMPNPDNDMNTTINQYQ